MGAQRLQDQIGTDARLARLLWQQVGRQRMRLELGAAAGGAPFPTRGRVAQETARAMQAVVEAGETGMVAAITLRIRA